MLPDINYSSVKKVIIIGHSLIADKMFISNVLKKCKNLKKILLFRYDGESEDSFSAKIKFLIPYCKRLHSEITEENRKFSKRFSQTAVDSRHNIFRAMAI